MARKPLEVSPKAERKEEPPRRENREKVQKPGWCRFVAKSRCTAGGIYLEAEQEVTFAPRDSWELRKNKNLTLLSGEIPKCPESVNVLDFIEDLEVADPKPGAAPVGERLIKQA